MSKNKKTAKKRNYKKLQYGTLSTVLTVVFIVTIMLGNAALTFLTDRYSWKADISAEGLYQISEQTEIMLKNLDQPVTAYILMSEAEAQGSATYAVASEFLQRYVTLSDGMFSVEYIDVYKDPTFMNNYDETSDVAAGSFILQSENRYRVCSLIDLYEISVTYDEEGYETEFISGFQADQTFASMLHYVTTGELPTVVKLTGHNEIYDAGFMDIFSKNNYEILECNLSLEEIPAKTDMLLLSSPNKDFTEEEIEKLDAYLREDFGAMMVFMDIEVEGELPLLELYFEEWGVSYKEAMVLDATRSLQAPYLVVPYVLQKDFTYSFAFDENTMVVTPNPRQMEVLYTSADSGSYVTTVVLETSADAYAKSYADGESIKSYAKEEGDAEGPFPMAVISQYYEWENNRPYYGHIMFFPTSDITYSGMLETKAFSNARFLTHSINFLNTTTDTITLEARDLTSTEMPIMTEQANVILVLLVVVIPVLMLALGMLAYVRRKNK